MFIDNLFAIKNVADFFFFFVLTTSRRRSSLIRRARTVSASSRNIRSQHDHCDWHSSVSTTNGYQFVPILLVSEKTKECITRVTWINYDFFFLGLKFFLQNVNSSSFLRRTSVSVPKVMAYLTQKAHSLLAKRLMK